MTIELAKEPKISFIVPAYGLDKGLLKKCLMSLEDQDYPNMEVICVLDGPDDELAKVAADFTDGKNFRSIEIEHSGAPTARNEGFKKSTGEIISFFNSDYIAKPGMVRMWVDELVKNPDCGFIYGPYEYATRDRAWYGSKPFDVYQLEQANYIDCGFPLWRKHVVEWDKDCKSLQDWDFWLRVVRKGVKGHFMNREISFVADMPRDKGLSMDSSSNWIERVNYVKKKNGIGLSQMVVTSVGAPYHGSQIAQMLNADYRDDTIFKPHDYKALYMVGFYLKPSDPPGNAHPQILAGFPDATKIVHFVGADIHFLKQFPHDQLRYIAGALNLKCRHVLCESSQAQEELLDMGINSKVVRIPPYQDFEVKPLPEKFSCAIFLTDHSDFDKYCQNETLSIVRACPDIQFMAYGDACKDYTYPNMTHHGNLNKEEWKEFVYKNSCYIRMVRHDTRPMASDEFILAGRDVITNCGFEGMNRIDTSGDPVRNEWDFFATGLNTFRWPDTKTEIVKRLRGVRDSKVSLEEREKIHNHYSQILDREKYVSTIWGMIND